MRREYSKGTMPPRNKKNFRSTKSGAGMTKAGVAAYRRLNPGSKLKTAVTGKVKPGSKAAKRRKSFCARSLGQMKKFPKAAKDPNSRLRQARRRDGSVNMRKAKMVWRYDDEKTWNEKRFSTTTIKKVRYG